MQAKTLTHLLILLAVVLLAGCFDSGGSSAKFSDSRGTWEFLGDERRDSIAVAQVPAGLDHWGDWAIETPTALMRVGLNAEPGKSGGILVPRSGTSLSTLSSSAVVVGDRLELCAPESGSEFRFYLKTGGGTASVQFRSLQVCA